MEICKHLNKHLLILPISHENKLSRHVFEGFDFDWKSSFETPSETNIIDNNGCCLVMGFEMLTKNANMNNLFLSKKTVGKAMEMKIGLKWGLNGNILIESLETHKNSVPAERSSFYAKTIFVFGGEKFLKTWGKKTY